IVVAIAVPGTLFVYLTRDRSAASNPSCGARPSTSVRALGPGRVMVGEPLPDVTLTGVDCHQYALAQFHGRPMIIAFFGSWCYDCREELPVLERLQRDEGNRIAVVGISFRDFPADTADFVRELKVTFPALLEDSTVNPVATRFHVRGIPDTLFVDAQGVLRDRAFGKTSRAELQPYISKLLGS
ncbi:MAG TPA: TlpA disulfide reductase family protein, partial [Acidimicrobiia bacterium]|nr:TlpA disulfide reductase family protein [Acidimicrobiia bacterium]